MCIFAPHRPAHVLIADLLLFATYQSSAVPPLQPPSHICWQFKLNHRPAHVQIADMLVFATYQSSAKTIARPKLEQKK